jgi:hypothetical protein
MFFYNVFFLHFRNLCLSLQPGCSTRDLLLLWQHECQWVYGNRLVTEVDYKRYKQAFVTAVKKEFSSEEQVRYITNQLRQLVENNQLHSYGQFIGQTKLRKQHSTIILSIMPMLSPLLSSQLYEKFTFCLSCHWIFHVNWTSFKRPPVLKDHFCFFPEVTS